MGGLNLHQIVRGAISTVNPDEQVVVYHSAGQRNDHGALTPIYREGVTMTAQVQTESERELFYAGAGSLGDNAIMRKFYLYAESVTDKTAAIIRPFARGGDLIYRPAEATWWLVTTLIEDFSPVGWVSVRGALQIKEEGFSPEVAP